VEQGVTGDTGSSAMREACPGASEQSQGVHQTREPGASWLLCARACAPCSRAWPQPPVPDREEGLPSVRLAAEAGGPLPRSRHVVVMVHGYQVSKGGRTLLRLEGVSRLEASSGRLLVSELVDPVLHVPCMFCGAVGLAAGLQPGPAAVAQRVAAAGCGRGLPHVGLQRGLRRGDGLAQMGARLAEETAASLRGMFGTPQHPSKRCRLARLSFVGHSLGAVVVRVALMRTCPPAAGLTGRCRCRTCQVDSCSTQATGRSQKVSQAVVPPSMRPCRPRLGPLPGAPAPVRFPERPPAWGTCTGPTSGLFSGGLWAMKKLQGSAVLHQLGFSDAPQMRATSLFGLAQVRPRPLAPPGPGPSVLAAGSTLHAVGTLALPANAPCPLLALAAGHHLAPLPPRRPHLLPRGTAAHQGPALSSARLVEARSHCCALACVELTGHGVLSAEYLEQHTQPWPSPLVRGPLCVQDRYVPYHSARMEVPQAALADAARGGAYAAMVDASLRGLLDAPQLTGAAEGPAHRQASKPSTREGPSEQASSGPSGQASSGASEQASSGRMESFTRCSVTWGATAKKQHLGLRSFNALLGRAAHVGFLESKPCVELFFWEHWEKLLLLIASFPLLILLQKNVFVDQRRQKTPGMGIPQLS